MSDLIKVHSMFIKAALNGYEQYLVKQRGYDPDNARALVRTNLDTNFNPNPSNTEWGMENAGNHYIHNAVNNSVPRGNFDSASFDTRSSVPREFSNGVKPDPSLAGQRGTSVLKSDDSIFRPHPSTYKDIRAFDNPLTADKAMANSLTPSIAKTLEGTAEKPGLRKGIMGILRRYGSHFKNPYVAGGSALGAGLLGGYFGGHHSGESDMRNAFKQNTSGPGGILRELGNAVGIVPNQNMFKGASENEKKRNGEAGIQGYGIKYAYSNELTNQAVLKLAGFLEPAIGAGAKVLGGWAHNMPKVEKLFERPITTGLSRFGDWARHLWKGNPAVSAGWKDSMLGSGVGASGGLGAATSAVKGWAGRNPWMAAGATALPAGYIGNRMGQNKGHSAGMQDMYSAYKQNTSGFGGSMREIGNALGLVSDQSMFMPKTASEQKNLMVLMNSVGMSNIKAEQMFKQAGVLGALGRGALAVVKGVGGHLGEAWGGVAKGLGGKLTSSGALAAAREGAGTGAGGLRNSIGGWFSNIGNKAVNWNQSGGGALANKAIDTMSGWGGTAARGVRGTGNLLGYTAHPMMAGVAGWGTVDGLVNRKHWTEDGAMTGSAQALAGAQNMSLGQRLGFLFNPSGVADRAAQNADQQLPGIYAKYQQYSQH